jgi:hypothetical protein
VVNIRLGVPRNSWGVDVATQQDSFADDPAVVRVDGDGPLIGRENLAKFHARRPTPGPRRLRDLHVVHSPGDTVVTVSVTVLWHGNSLTRLRRR